MSSASFQEDQPDTLKKIALTIRNVSWQFQLRNYSLVEVPTRWTPLLRTRTLSEIDAAFAYCSGLVDQNFCSSFLSIAPQATSIGLVNCMRKSKVIHLRLLFEVRGNIVEGKTLR